ncbi:hypothetical protein SELMODRAFT_451355 [Selaginella moellendorffii]|uniref:Uncharacterized protein WOX7-2 n=2 Tax=Selaginella moellendorffii TaxID=88036 RepID=D8RWE8_SELML|nr:hypothetical protein SELMODRAFT_451355 [Selaginella moellendorffii]
MDRQENPRYSKRLRAKAEEKSPVKREPPNADEILLRSALDRPEYHPDFGIVMSAQQLDELRRQIAVYATICQQLVEMHKASMANPNGASSSRPPPPSPLPPPPLPPPPPVKATTRQRWAPSQAQVKLLESLYDVGMGTPHKQRVREITAELSQLGPVNESNVYNWFQNRKARTRRRNRQQPSALGGPEPQHFPHRELEEVDSEVDAMEGGGARGSPGVVKMLKPEGAGPSTEHAPHSNTSLL